MKLLLGSGGFRTPERIARLTLEMRSFFGSASRLLFIPHALADHDGYLQRMIDRGINAGYSLDGIHRQADPVHAVQHVEAIFIGGNTFRLLDALHRLHLLDAIRTRVHSGIPYLGISAGCNVACPTIKTTNDMPIAQPPSFAALGLVPFQINPHYYHGATYLQDGEHFYRQHFGETRDERIREFHEEHDAPVIGLWEGGIIRVETPRIMLLAAPARVFRKGHEPGPGLSQGARTHRRSTRDGPGRGDGGGNSLNKREASAEPTL